MDEIFTLQKLKELVYHTREISKFKCERGYVAESFLSPNEENFEAVRFNRYSTRLLLLPSAKQFQFLFRGQCKDFTPCRATLYRGNPSEIDMFIERMRLMQFKALIDEYPIVKYFFKPKGYIVNYEGLAQHYGLKTSLLDLTSSLDIALFFAMCPYNRETDNYKCIDKDESQAVLYIVNPFLDYGLPGNKSIPNPFENKISVIGLQAFDRPGNQRGFGIRMNKKENFGAWMYHFSFTKSDSQWYFNKYQQGKKLWVKDVLVDKTKKIAIQTSFDYTIFKQTIIKYAIPGYTESDILSQLKNKGITISHNLSQVEYFSKSEIYACLSEWVTTKGKIVIDHIMQRKIFIENPTTHKMEWDNFRTVDMLTTEAMLRFIQIGMRAPQGGKWRGDRMKK